MWWVNIYVSACTAATPVEENWSMRGGYKSIQKKSKKFKEKNLDTTDGTEGRAHWYNLLWI